METERGEKKNYAQTFSENMATCIANKLRREFPEITPGEHGKPQEARARTAKGFKKLDVNYSKPELGLALGVSIKSIHNMDPKTKRFTKNYSRNDNELRAEATDYHQRQPYAVLVGALFLPISACDDAGRARKEETGISSFGAAVKSFRTRANRRTPHDDVDLFERFFIGLYDPATGDVMMFDVMDPPPKNRRPRSDECRTFDGFIYEIIRTYEERNDPPFHWAR